MARSFTQVPPDSTGDKLAMQTYTQGADTVHVQGVYHPGLPTFRALADASAISTNKYHIYLRNDTGSNQTIYLTRLMIVNVQVTTVTGVAIRCDLRRVTGTPSGGSSITPYAFNSNDTALSGVTAITGPSSGLVDSTIVQPIVFTTDEHTAAATNVQQVADKFNLLPTPDGLYSRPLALRPGEALAIKQVTTATAGSISLMIDFAVEAD